MRHQFIPSITGGKTINDNERELLALPPRLGGLGLRNVCLTAPIEHDNSKALTRSLQNEILGMSEEDVEVAKSPAMIKNERRQRSKDTLDEVRARMSDEQKRTNEANSMVGASNWLTNLPIKELGYELNKEQFQDALRIRYSWSLPRLPTECVCGSRFDIAHALSCKKGGFVTLRHNEIRDLTSIMLNEVCPDVRREPRLVEMDGEHLTYRTANRSQEARLDISATGFWTPGQRAFFDIRVFDLNARRYSGLGLEKCFRRNESEKKRHYNERVTNIENGTFTPLVFSTSGGMGRECKTFYKRLCEMMAEKRGETPQRMTDFIRTKLSYSLLRSTLLCIRGSRSLKIDHSLSDIQLANSLSKVGDTGEWVFIIFIFGSFFIKYLYIFYITSTTHVYYIVYGVPGQPPCIVEKKKKYIICFLLDISFGVDWIRFMEKFVSQQILMSTVNKHWSNLLMIVQYSSNDMLLWTDVNRIF